METTMEGKPITITLHVNAAAAVREGNAAAGPMRVRIDDADLRAMTMDERNALILHLEDAEHFNDPIGADPQWGHPLTRHADPVGHADIKVLRALLRRRIEVMRPASSEAAHGT